MSYPVFIERVKRLVQKNGISCRVDFSQEDGKYHARFSDGVHIMGNSMSSRVLVKWGSGHTAMATI